MASARDESTLFPTWFRTLSLAYLSKVLPDSGMAILIGNFFGSRIRFGRYDANKGVVLLGDGHGHFKDVPNHQSGISIHGEVRDIARVKLASGLEILLLYRGQGT